MLASKHCKMLYLSESCGKSGTSTPQNIFFFCCFQLLSHNLSSSYPVYSIHACHSSCPTSLHLGPLLWSLPDSSMFCTSSLYLNFTSCHLHCSLIFLSCTHGSCLVSTDCFIPLFSSAYLHLSGFSPTCSLLSLQITSIIDGDSCLPDLLYPPVHHHCKTTLLPHASISLSLSCSTLTYLSATPDSE